MPRSVGRVGVDSVVGPGGTGKLIGPIVPNVYVNGMPIAVEFTPIAPHNKFPHDGSSIMEAKNFTVKVGGHYVVASGDLATCGDTLVSTSNVYIA